MTVMPQECGGLATAGRQLEIVAKQFAIHRMRAVVNDYVGSLYGVKSAQVGYTLIGHDDVYRVFGVVHV